MRALVLDADARASHAIGLMLEASNMGVDRADSAKQAIELTRLHHYDVIVLDLILPDMSGRQLVRRIRGDDIARPMLVLSRVDQPLARALALEAGADAFMPKPFTRAELLARIRMLLPGDGRPRQPATGPKDAADAGGVRSEERRRSRVRSSAGRLERSPRVLRDPGRI